MSFEVKYLPSGPVYESNSKLFRYLRLMIQELFVCRELAWRFFLRDFNARYRQSILGAAWAVAGPVATVGIFVVLNKSGLLKIGDIPVPYPAYALLGLTIWGLFSMGTTAICNSLVNADSMIIKINFPKIALVIASTGQPIFVLLIRIVLVIIVFLYYGIIPGFTGVLLSFMALFPIYLLTLGLGFILSIANVVVRDITNAAEIILSALMLVTPVLYPVTPVTALGIVNKWNPLNYLVNGARDLVLKGAMENPGGYLFSVVFVIAVFLVGWRIFYFGQRKIAELV